MLSSDLSQGGVELVLLTCPPSQPCWRWRGHLSPTYHSMRRTDGLEPPPWRPWSWAFRNSGVFRPTLRFYFGFKGTEVQTPRPVGGQSGWEPASLSQHVFGREWDSICQSSVTHPWPAHPLPGACYLEITLRVQGHIWVFIAVSSELSEKLETTNFLFIYIGDWLNQLRWTKSCTY